MTDDEKRECVRRRTLRRLRSLWADVGWSRLKLAGNSYEGLSAFEIRAHKRFVEDCEEATVWLNWDSLTVNQMDLLEVCKQCGETYLSDYEGCELCRACDG